MPQWLINLTQPQATLASGAMTFLGALFAVLLGWWLFNGRVNDMKSALDATERLLANHQSNVRDSLVGIEDKLSTLTASAAQLRADVSDRQAIDEEAPDEADAPVNTVALTFDTFASNWRRIRDRLEQIASAKSIDGRTAAKYARIDRRNYSDLVAALNKDQSLDGKADQFLEAAQLWASHRSRRREPSEEDAQRMIALGLLLAPPE